MKVRDCLVPGPMSKDFWPSNSPDLNPLDFSFLSVLEEKVSATSRQSLDSLTSALSKAWDELD
ncbi:hypothetical protein HPB49_004413 [Dermacentor silvarum]|uniref:Uncharacterized protein n=1 Tax=Dermacentor silvarum TaxID=543639 RepID=A0ACB8DI06_DERSI|nr:hypothetical protein HPB49_004413 [Dermacentor silvarum]